MKKGFCTSEKNIIDIREYMSVYLREQIGCRNCEMQGRFYNSTLTG